MAKTISLYLSEQALEKLDACVQMLACKDEAAGLSGRAVTSRSSFIEKLIDAYEPPQEVLSPEEITYAVVSLAQEYGAKKVSLFGSYARGEATGASDVDLLLEKGSIKGLQVLDFQEALAKQLGRPVDVVTTAGASERFLAKVSQEAKVLYEVVEL
ncbi:nucleotidyltransferase domain-containing protein [Adlercreutzia equolifaciens]|uniref:nucleotidyltransferase family protein n=1 Tax=Adlercreutzia equolifaciens TaxID=446660 RepID=UPI0023B05953|nr:nucleotidyltransferase domain-containing protein [Adlercreutzia equolifaciens]MDE8703211.1 nucleotidyltransferase domain-containing protein [Adlercreutzia equolifaciens]